MWKGKHVLLGISGGIAAYKTPELIRLFVKAGAEVRVVVTQNALSFVTPLTLETVSKNSIYKDVFDAVGEYSTEHVALADWADLFLIAPATANCIGKFANGISDDALSTTFLAFDKPIFLAPAMNDRMYRNAAVQSNLQRLKETGVMLLEPVEGELACGTTGKGRMEEPQAIFNVISRWMDTPLPWQGKTILITAGPTYERIDPVRFIGNLSTGKMGFALAEACAERGAKVILIAGPVSLKTTSTAIQRIDVESAGEMYDACIRLFPVADMGILCAAVADFTPEKQADTKTKRKEANLQVVLKPTQDIAAALGRQKKPNQLLVGFALETDNEEVNALDKMERKNLDFIVLNSLRNPGAGFGHDTNQVTIFSRNGQRVEHPLKSKTAVAEDILDTVGTFLHS